jgi:hypothetical protein
MVIECPENCRNGIAGGKTRDLQVHKLAADCTTTKRRRNDDETSSQRKTTRTPTPLRRDSPRYPSPTIANFDLRRRVNGGASYMLACSCRRPSLPVVCLLSRCPWSRKNGLDMVVAAKVHSGIESCLRGVCTLAIGNGMAYCIGRY